MQRARWNGLQEGLECRQNDFSFAADAQGHLDGKMLPAGGKVACRRYIACSYCLIPAAFCKSLILQRLKRPYSLAAQLVDSSLRRKSSSKESHPLAAFPQNLAAPA
ncbi:MAG: hypothetical protein WBF04_05350 [Candidatus Sulfotelmatobacter sp.]